MECRPAFFDPHSRKNMLSKKYSYLVYDVLGGKVVCCESDPPQAETPLVGSFFALG